MCEAGSSTLEELLRRRKAASALGLRGNRGVNPLWWKSGCAEVAVACNEVKEHGGSEQRHLAAGFLETTEEGQAGTGGCVRPVESLAALPWGRAKLRMKLWCIRVGAKAQPLLQVFLRRCVSDEWSWVEVCQPGGSVMSIVGWK